MPEMGLLETLRARAAEEVDPNCAFWRAGRTRYVAVLGRYLAVLGSGGVDEGTKHTLLADLGFHVIQDFVTPQEETEMLRYWRPGGQVYAWGAYELGTKRRFFHYGPILKLKTELSSKSTLSIIPGRLGAMPPLLARLGIRERIRRHLLVLGVAPVDDLPSLDQLYVNYYAAKLCSGIAFHHDNMKTMCGVVAGVSLGNPCEMHLLALDKELRHTSVPVRLPACSLYLMTGLSRFHLQHGIPALSVDRVSLSFRTVRTKCAERSLWRRDWAGIPKEEAANAHWPLLAPPPDGSAP